MKQTTNEFIGSGEEWNNLFPYLPLQQSYEYGQLLELLGRKVRRLIVANEHGNLALMQLVSRSFMGIKVTTALRAPIFLQDEDIDFKGLFPKKWREFIILQPQEREIKDLPKIMSEGYFAVLDLTEYQPSGKWQNSLLKGEKMPQEIVNSDVFQDCLQVIKMEVKQRKNRGYFTYSRDFLHFMCKYFAEIPDGLQIYLAKSKGEIIAGAIFLQTGNTGHYLCSFATDKARQMNSHHVILHRAAEYLRNLGCEYLDLGILDDENNAGLAFFKLSTGAKAFRTSGVYSI